MKGSSLEGLLRKTSFRNEGSTSLQSQDDGKEVDFLESIKKRRWHASHVTVNNIYGGSERH